MLRLKTNKKSYIAAVGALSLVTVGGVTVALAPLAAAKLDTAGSPTVQRLIAMLDARSPGERVQGELTKAKLARAKLPRTPPKLAGIVVPKQRALGKVFQPTPPPSKAFVEALVPPPPIMDVPQLASNVPFKAILPSSPLPLVVGGLVIPSTGGGTPPGLPENPPLVVASAVPEPSTWLMMILGFGFVGLSLRRRSADSRMTRRTA